RTIAVSKSSDATLASYFKSDVADSAKASSELIKKIEPLLLSQQEKDLFQQLMEMRKEYSASRDGVMKLKSEGKAEEAAKLLDERFVPIANRYKDMAGQFVQMQRDYLDQKGKEIDAIEAASRVELIGLAALVCALGIL